MPRIGEILVTKGVCSPEAIQEALQNQSFFGARLGTNLLHLGAARESQIAEALQQLHGVPCLSGDVPADPKAIALVRKELVEKYEVIPYLTADRKLAVLVRDPRDCHALDDIAFATGKSVYPFVVPEARLWALMRKLYGIERGLRGVDVDLSGRHPANGPHAAHARPAERPPLGDLMNEDDFLALYGR